MAETFFSAVNYPLSLLIQNVEAGEIALSGIQRPFVWPNAKVRDLFDSMYRGFPVGYLLFAPYDAWRSGAAGRAPRLLIVDGQQRLTSLYSVIKGTTVMREDFREERICLAFRPRDSSFEVADTANRLDPEFVQDIGPLLSGQVPQYRFVREFLDRLRARRVVDEEEEARISSAIYRLYELPSYSFTVLQLSRSLDEEQVAEVFVRINSRGVPLSMADFVLTVIAVAWEEGRRQLESFCRRTREESSRGEASPFNTILRPTPDRLLKAVAGLAFRRVRLQAVYSLLQGRDPDTRQISEELRAERFKEFEKAQRWVLNVENWHDFLEAVRAAGYRSSEMVPAESALLSCYTLFLIGKRDFAVGHSVLRNLTARFVFVAMVTGRYAGSGETAIEADLARLRDVKDAASYVALQEEIVAASLDEQYWMSGLPGELDTASTRCAAALGYQAAMVIQDATGLFSDEKIADHFEGGGTLARRQLFPRRHLARSGKALSLEAGQMANYVLAGADIVMTGDPREYYPRLAATLPPERVAEMAGWHALPAGWENMAYGAFLRTRREAMAKVMREAFGRLSNAPVRSEPVAVPLKQE